MRRLITACLIGVGLSVALWYTPVNTAQAIDGCTASDVLYPAGESQQTLLFEDTERTFTLVLPPDYDSAQPMPLVLSLHGVFSDAAQQQVYTGWDALAARETVIIAYPNGTGFPRRWFGDFGNFDNDELNASVRLMQALINELSANLCLDPARIYINGFSNGGGLAYKVACTLSQTVAAVGIVSGAFPTQNAACDPTRSVSIIVFHGDADRVVPYDGSADTHSPAQFAAEWGARNGCDPTPESLEPQGAVSGVRYVGCTDDAEVVFYSIAGGGHNWPGGGVPESVFMADNTTTDISATEAMWTFFVAHPLPIALP
ncbi:MAG: dienelactone hydrolase family protein [Armatimonadetes bacterium]|nr:dienelactone hydrolase family protein [Anaerolineae bacterium]